MLTNFIEIFKNKGEIYLRIKVRPGSSFNTVKEVMADETIKIDIKAPAQKGKANKELIKFLAEIFHIAQGGIKILSGASDRTKLIKLIK